MQALRLFAALLASGATLLAQPAAHAATDYPNKPITLIVPFPAGSGTDAVGRIFGVELSAILGLSLIHI